MASAGWGHVEMDMAEAERISGEEIADWLGTRNETLYVVADAGRSPLTLAQALAALASLAVITWAWRERFTLPPSLLIGVILLTPLLVGLLAGAVQGWLLPPYRLEAGPDGLVLRRGRRRRALAWADIVSLRHNPELAYAQQLRVYDLRLADVTLTFDNRSPHAQKLVVGLTKALQARERGAVLPTDRPLAATALSRAGAPSQGRLDAGLSRAEKTDVDA